MVKTIFIKNTIDKEQSINLYKYLVENIEWVEGIRSRKGYTRKARTIFSGQMEVIDNLIRMVLNDHFKSKINSNYIVLGYYLNYYENGEMWTPNHSHKSTHQLVISLGGPRILTVGKKEYLMESGDSILFGSSIHGVPKDSERNEGRISIATFMIEE